MRTDELRAELAEVVRRQPPGSGNELEEVRSRAKRIRRRRRNRSIGSLGLAGVALVTGLAVFIYHDGGDGSPLTVVAAPSTSAVDSEASRADSVADLVSHVRGRFADALVLYLPARSLADLLPNTKYDTVGRGLITASDAAVVGRITEVRPGRGFVASGDDVDGRETSFDDPDARWRTVELVVEVETRLGGDVGDEVVVGFAIGSSLTLATVQEGFLTFDRVVLFLIHSPVFAYDPSLWAMSGDGLFLTTIGPDGSLDMPFAEPDGARRLTADVPSLEVLVDAAARPTRTIQVTGPSGF